jgi:hypothetical protein
LESLGLSGFAENGGLWVRRSTADRLVAAACAASPVVECRGLGVLVFGVSGCYPGVVPCLVYQSS